MDEFKKDFPLINNLDIHYLDSAATTQKPYMILEEIDKYYSFSNGNAGRGSHKLAIENTKIIEDVRAKVAEFVGVFNKKQIVFTKNSTESLNMIAFSYALNILNKDDEIIIAISNHHSNIIPWQEVAKKTGARLRYLYLNKDGSLDMKQFGYMLSKRVKIVSISTVVNTTGVIQDFNEVIELSHRFGAKVVLDCAQSIIHFKHEFDKWDVDFGVFSGHKIFSGFGVGILFGKKELLDEMQPFIFGGDMVEYVEEESSTFKDVPHKFEGGTLNIESIKTLGVAIDYINSIGYHRIYEHEKELMRYAQLSLALLDFVEVYYPESDRVGIIPFNVKGVHSHDSAFILDNMNVAVRSGQHCTAPLMKYMGINSCCRASFGIYNTKEDVDALVGALKEVNRVFNENKEK